MANQATAVPACSRWKVEVFRYSTLSDTPDEVMYVRSGTGAENAARCVGKPWPTVAPALVAGYLKPTGANAGRVDTLQNTLSWTAAAGSTVLSGYLFASNAAIATNSQNETATFAARSRLDFEPAVYGDINAPALEFASVVAGTSMSPHSSSSGNDPNPRCTSQSVLPLTTNTSDYREIGLALRGSDRKLYNAIWFWDN